MAFSIKNFRYGLPKEEEKPVKIKEFTIKEAPLRQPSGLSLSQIDALQDRKAYELEQKESIPYQAPIQVVEKKESQYRKDLAQSIKTKFDIDMEDTSLSGRLKKAKKEVVMNAEQRKEYGQLLQEYMQSKALETPFRAGIAEGSSPLSLAEELSKKAPEETEALKKSSDFRIGEFLGKAGLIGAGYGLLGGAIAGPSVATGGGIGGATGTLAPTLAQKAAYTLGTGALGTATTELAKDIAIGSPIAGIEALSSGKDVKKELAENMLMDVAIGAGFSLAGQGLKALKNTNLVSDVVERFAKQTNTPIDESVKIVDDVIENPIKSTSNVLETPKVPELTISKPTELPETLIKQAETPRVETTIEPPKPKSILEKIQEPIEEIVDDRLLKKFRLDLFGATKEKPVDAIVDGVEKRVISVFDNEQGVKIAKLNDGTEVSFDSIKPSKKYTPFVSDDMQINVFEKATELKDIGTTTRYTTDVFRNFERVFDKNSQAFKTVKKNLLDPFDNAKGNMADDVIKLTDELDEVVVKGLGIKPKSKESKLVMRFGEGRIDYDGLVNEVGPEKAVKIVEADQFFRRKYDQLLDEININRINMNKPIIEKRQDYYRHYNDIANTFESIKNIIESGRAIDPKLSGLSEFTRPREAWASFKQRRTDGTKFTEDAVGGFLDYIRAGTYAKHIDPVISEFRSFRNTLANETTESRNLNRFIEYLDDFTNDLAGKTNPFDRWIQKLIGREGLALLNTVNSRVKANAVLGNLSSSVSQIANVPQGIATIKDPQALTLGLKNFMESIGGGGDSKLYKQSSFLKERYLNDAYSKFDRRLIDQPKKTAAWLLGALDEVGTKYIWSSAHAKALKEGIENPIKYADDLTRKMVGGRGIGEVPLAQKSNLTQLIAPFTLEVNNLWKVMQDMGKDKDIAGLTMLFVANYGLNRAIEEIRGSDVTFDPINAILEGYDRNEDFSDNITNVGGSLLGEALSNLPFGAAIGSVYPEYGARIGDIEFPTRAELFGESDPTRYGISVPLVRAVQDPAKNLLLPWGGGQVSKTIKGAQTMGLLPQNILSESGEKESITMPASVSASGKIRTLVEPSLPKTAQALAFGGYASPEVREFFEGTGVPFGENQTPKIIQLVQEGFDSQKLQQALTKGRKVTKKDERRKILEDSGFSPIEVNRIMEVFYGYKVD